MRKLYYIDKLETKRSMLEIEEKVRDIVSENQIFHRGALFYLFCCGLYFGNPDSEEALQQFV